MQSILPIVGLAFCAQGAFAQTSIALSLQDAMQRARQYSQQVYTANIAALLAHEDTIQAKAGLLPTAEGVSGFIYTQPNGTPSGIYVPNDGPRVYTELLNLHGDVYNPAKRAEYHRIIAAEAVAQAKRDLAERGLVARTASHLDRRSVRVSITAAGRELIDQGAAEFEAEIAVLVDGLPPAQRSRLSLIASRVVAADARRRGIDIYATTDRV